MSQIIGVINDPKYELAISVLSISIIAGALALAIYKLVKLFQINSQLEAQLQELQDQEKK